MKGLTGALASCKKPWPMLQWQPSPPTVLVPRAQEPLPPHTHTYTHVHTATNIDTQMHVCIIHGHMYSDAYHRRVTHVCLGSVVLGRDPGHLNLVQPWRVGSRLDGCLDSRGYLRQLAAGLSRFPGQSLPPCVLPSMVVSVKQGARTSDEDIQG